MIIQNILSGISTDHPTASRSINLTVMIGAIDHGSPALGQRNILLIQIRARDIQRSTNLDRISALISTSPIITIEKAREKGKGSGRTQSQQSANHQYPTHNNAPYYTTDNTRAPYNSQTTPPQPEN